MTDKSPAANVNQAESDRMTAAGLAFWNEIKAIVDANPFYDGATEPERSACVARLAQQALSEAVTTCVPGSREQAFTMLSGMGRMIGQLLHLAGPERGALMSAMLRQEISIGALDIDAVLKPQGQA